jgi:hypothetical protein
MTSYLIFGCTSRGGKLSDYISNHYPFPNNIRTSSIVRGGGLISEIYKDVKSKIDSISLNEGDNIIVVFCAGLCDLATKVKHDFGAEITYSRESSNCNHIIPELTAIQSELFKREIPVICTICSKFLFLPNLLINAENTILNFIEMTIRNSHNAENYLVNLYVKK